MPRLLAAVPLALCLAIAASADETRTITVKGHGTAMAKPDVMVLTFRASGKAEKAADAVTKLKEKLETMKAGLEKVLADKKAQNAKVEDTGLSFVAAAGSNGGQVVIFNGGGGTTTEGGAGDVSATSEVHVTVSAVDAMKNEDVAALVSALLDKGSEDGGAEQAEPTGFNVWMPRAGSSPVAFKFSDPDKAMGKAWDAAVAKARARAETIASRLNLSVGGALKVRDLTDGEPETKSASAMAASTAKIMLAGLGGAAPAGGSSGETEVTADIEVEFELTKAGK